MEEANARTAEIRQALAAVPAPPWRWIGVRHAGGPQLVTDHSGRQYLLRAKKPVDGHGEELLDPVDDGVVYGDLEFRDQREGERYSTLRSGGQLGIGRTSYDPDSIVGIANPIASWLENSPRYVTDALARITELEAQLTKYVGHEPTIAEEMAYLSNCLDSVRTVCNQAEQQASRWENPLPVPEWVAKVRAAADGLEPRRSYPPALPWAALMDTDDLAEFMSDLDAAMRDAARQAHLVSEPQAPNVLAAVEKTCATWRAIAEAQHAHNTAPGPDAPATGGAS